MPNWCNTSIRICHSDSKQIDRLAELITQWTSNNYRENGFGLKWLGNIAGNSGIHMETSSAGKPEVRCRGILLEMKKEEQELHLFTETAWCPILQMWQRIVDRYLPDAEIFFAAEETGMGIFVTNEPDLEDCYVVDVYGDVKLPDLERVSCMALEPDCCDGVWLRSGQNSNLLESNWEATGEEVRELLQKLLSTDIRDIPVLLEQFQKSEYQDKMSIHLWEPSQISDWE